MPVKGVSQLKNNVGKWVVAVTEQNTKQVLTAIAMTGAGYAKLATPVDTTALINSQYYKVNGDQAIIGYTAGFSTKDFNYALHLHNNTEWTPRKKKAATHHFLSDAFESPEYKADYQQIILNGYKL